MWRKDAQKIRQRPPRLFFQSFNSINNPSPSRADFRYTQHNNQPITCYPPWCKWCVIFSALPCAVNSDIRSCQASKKCSASKTPSFLHGGLLRIQLIRSVIGCIHFLLPSSLTLQWKKVIKRVIHLHLIWVSSDFRQKRTYIWSASHLSWLVTIKWHLIHNWSNGVQTICIWSPFSSDPPFIRALRPHMIHIIPVIPAPHLHLIQQSHTHPCISSALDLIQTLLPYLGYFSTKQK